MALYCGSHLFEWRTVICASVVGANLSVMHRSSGVGTCDVSTHHLSVAHPMVRSIHARNDFALQVGTSRPDPASRDVPVPVLEGVLRNERPAMASIGKRKEVGPTAQRTCHQEMTRGSQATNPGTMSDTWVEGHPQFTKTGAFLLKTEPSYALIPLTHLIP